MLRFTAPVITGLRVTVTPFDTNIAWAFDRTLSRAAATLRDMDVAGFEVAEDDDEMNVDEGFVDVEVVDSFVDDIVLVVVLDTATVLDAATVLVAD